VVVVPIPTAELAPAAELAPTAELAPPVLTAEPRCYQHYFTGGIIGLLIGIIVMKMVK
jgi:hypothetical protein